MCFFPSPLPHPKPTMQLRASGINSTTKPYTLIEQMKCHSILTIFLLFSPSLSSASSSLSSSSLSSVWRRACQHDAVFRDAETTNEPYFSSTLRKFRFNFIFICLSVHPLVNCLTWWLLNKRHGFFFFSLNNFFRIVSFASFSAILDSLNGGRYTLNNHHVLSCSAQRIDRLKERRFHRVLL